MSNRTIVCDHPMMQTVLAELRDKKTRPARFRALMEDAGVMLGQTALAYAKTRSVSVTTPLPMPTWSQRVTRCSGGSLNGLLVKSTDHV